jgi:type IV secretion system protein VirD4
VLAAKLPSLLLFFGCMVLVGYGAFLVQTRNRALPDGRDTFFGFLPYVFRKQDIWLAIAAFCEYRWGFGFGIIVLLFAAVPMFAITVKSGREPKLVKDKDLAVSADQANQQWLNALGPNALERSKAIESMFNARSQTVTATLFDKWYTYYRNNLNEQVEQKHFIKFGAARSLATMDYRERETLRWTEHLNSLADGKNTDYRAWRTALVWGDGKGQQYGDAQWEGLDPKDPIGEYMKQKGLTVDQVITSLSIHVRELKDDRNANDAVKFIARHAFQTISGETHDDQIGAGSGLFLTPAEVPSTIFKTRGPYGVGFGTFDDGSWLAYSGSGAMVTIAPPGSGKSQCHVIPNLLQWKAPAVVLDVKGELYAATSKWRAANVGPVYRFAPTDPDRSHHYNPLAFISDHPDQIWQESRFLTDMLIVPSGSKDQFWDNKAKELVSAAVAYICYSTPAGERHMSQLLDIIHGGKPFEQMLIGLSTAVDVQPMVRAGTSLSEMNEKTRDSVLATVLTSFHGWEDAPVARVTDRCDWSPLDLRNGSGGKHPTVYICLKPREVEGYISLLRVLIAQHIRMLTGEMPSESDRDRILPILFLLDELPRLKEMPPVAEAIEIGASYGLRIWMFAQHLSQMQNAYPTADGMISACAVRIYMNPSGADGLAKKLSEELGTKETLADGTRKPMLEASELAGPKWANLELVFGTSTRPARLKKAFAYDNPALKDRMGAFEPWTSTPADRIGSASQRSTQAEVRPLA